MIVHLTRAQAKTIIIAANYGIEAATEGGYMNGRDVLVVERAGNAIRHALYSTTARTAGSKDE